MGTILFFEDDMDFANGARSNLSKKFGPTVEIKLAREILSASSNDRTFVERLYNDIEKVKPVELIVADINLGGTDHYRGLSAEIVSDVGRRMFIPVCVYARKIPSDIERIKQSVDAIIKLECDPDSNQMLSEIKFLYGGFVEIKKTYKRMDVKIQNAPLPRILATILNKPQYVDRFSLYSLGNQGFLKYVPIEEKPNKKLRLNTIPYILGNWLLLSILKFPGILLNKIATASYLNINEHDFNNPNVSNLFKTALYMGPFTNLGNYWWRYDLDKILDESKVNTGLDLARKKVNSRIKPCKCTVDNRLDAGYYCIITNRPVSLEKSTSEVSWIPKGADLARVSTVEYNKLKPWIGIL